MTAWTKGYGSAFEKRVREMYHGTETKKEFEYSAGTMPGSIVIGASKQRPIAVLKITGRIEVKETTTSDQADGSGDLVADKLLKELQAGDGFDLLLDLGLYQAADVMHAYTGEDSDASYENIGAGSSDSLQFNIFLPCYSEIPIWVTAKLGNVLDEYSGSGTAEIDDTADNVITVSAVYLNGSLGMEQPYVHGHSENLGAGQNALNSMKENLVHHGILMSRSSYADGQSELITDDFNGYKAKDDDNEVVSDQNAYDMNAYMFVHGGDSKAYVNLMTSKLGYDNNDLAAFKMGVENETTLTYVACYSGHRGDLKKKRKAYQKSVKSARTT